MSELTKIIKYFMSIMDEQEKDQVVLGHRRLSTNYRIFLVRK